MKPGFLGTGKHTESYKNYVRKVFTGHHKTKTQNKWITYVQNEIRIALHGGFGTFVLALPADFSTLRWIISLISKGVRLPKTCLVRNMSLILIKTN